MTPASPTTRRGRCRFNS